MVIIFTKILNFSPNLKLALIFRKLFGRLLILEKQNYQTNLLCLFQELHINVNVLSKFINLCWAAFIVVLGRGLDSPDLDRWRDVKLNRQLCTIPKRILIV